MEVMLPFVITRWRRGSLLTVYRMKSEEATHWWFYGPFNFAVAFSIPRQSHNLQPGVR